MRSVRLFPAKSSAEFEMKLAELLQIYPRDPCNYLKITISSEPKSLLDLMDELIFKAQKGLPMPY